MAANRTQYLSAVGFRQIQIEEHEVRQGLSPRLPHVRDVSQGFLAVANHVQALPDVMFLQRLLHEQNVSGVVFQQKYHNARSNGLSSLKPALKCL